jgi:hypothetical protein
MYHVLVLPSEDDEKKFEDIEEYDHAFWTAKTIEADYEVFTFETVEEQNAFVLGYKKGCGYLGSGLYFKKQIN